MPAYTGLVKLLPDKVLTLLPGQHNLKETKVIQRLFFETSCLDVQNKLLLSGRVGGHTS
jgi:hypothetical protein